MRRLLVILGLAAALLALLVAPPLAAADIGQPTVVAQFPVGVPGYGAFAESMAADSHGALYVSITYFGADTDSGQVWRVPPGGSPCLVASLDVTAYGQLMGVAVDARDRVYVGLWDFSSFAGEPETIGSGVYRLDGGALTRVVSLPPATAPNGLAFHDGRLYISDCVNGAIWRTRPADDVVAAPGTPWLQDPLLAASNSGLGVNGIAFKGHALYGAVSATGRVVRVPVRPDGTAGRLTVVARDPRLKTADGIAFDILGRLWVVTNGAPQSPSGGIYRVAVSGAVTAVAEKVDWLDYPTQPVFGRTPATATTLFIANGAYLSRESGGAPNVIALPAGVTGLPPC